MTALAVDGRGSIGGTSPMRSRRPSEGAVGEAGEALLVGVARRQRDLDAGDEFGDPRGDLDEGQPQGVELGVAPERGLGRQAATLVAADFAEHGDLLADPSVRAVPVDPIAPGDQTRPYAPRAIPVDRTGDGVDPERPPPRMTDGGRISFDIVDLPDFGRAIFVNGEIRTGDSDRFERALATAPAGVGYVALHSPGGRVVEAIRMGRLVREQELETVVTARGACVSACPLVLFGGVERHVSESAWVGMHQAYFDGTSILPMAIAVEEIQSLQSEVIAFTHEMGVDPAVHVFALSTPPNEAYFFVADELEAYNVATTIMD